MTRDPCPGATHVTAIILAAGAGARFGALKMLARYAGQPLIRHAVTAVQEAGVSPIIVVVPPGSTIEPALAGLAVQATINTAAATGIASSIRAGIHAVPTGTEAILITLGDQPTITPQHIRRIVTEHCARGSAITVSDYDGLLAPPAVFDRSVFLELLELEGDRGARPVIERDPQRVLRISVDGPFPDIDTPEDLATLERRSRSGA